MSGNYVQRGEPAMWDKLTRAKAAIACGADLVLELPVTTALSSAEGFAAGGVKVLNRLCDFLCFGAEAEDPQALTEAAQALLSDRFPPLLRRELEAGKSFPAARQAALEAMGAGAHVLSQPNNILGVEYCKAILSQGCTMKPFPIHREGSYHAEIADKENPSATSVRKLMLNDYNWNACVPKQCREIFQNAPLHSLEAGERAILYRLRTMTDYEYEALPYGSEGLWRKLMHNARKFATLEEIITATKSKRYTRTRLDRMVMCAFLGLTARDLQTPAPYVRVLALNDKGREILLKARQSGQFPNIGEKIDHPYQSLETRCDDLYGLFSPTPEHSGITQSRRIYYQKYKTLSICP
jgi:predicted nucleotidyltransferase